MNAQFALVAVTTETELGVATPWMVSGTGGVVEGGGVFDEGGVTAEVPPPPPHAAMRHNSAARPAAVRARRSDLSNGLLLRHRPTGEWFRESVLRERVCTKEETPHTSWLPLQ